MITMKWTPEKIRILRKELGLSQQAFGVLIGVSRVYVGYMEGGERRPGKTMQILLDFIEEREMKMKKESDVNVSRKRKTAKRDL